MNLYLFSLPFSSTDIPPLQDYVNHLARVYIINNQDSELISKYYGVQWNAIPNLAMDVIVPVISNYLPLIKSGKIFLYLIMILQATGVMAIQFALYREFNYLSLFSFIFIPNLALLMGFINFSFGVGLTLWSFAGWIYIRNYSVWTRLFFYL